MVAIPKIIQKIRKAAFAHARLVLSFLDACKQ
jgi:hypothetical protein